MRRWCGATRCSAVNVAVRRASNSNNNNDDNKQPLEEGVGMFNYPTDARGAPNDMRLPAEANYDGPVRGATGPDNTPGVYAQPTPPAYFERAYPPHPNSAAPTPGPHEPRDRSDNVKQPEHTTSRGAFERPPSFAGGPGAMRYADYHRELPKETVDVNDVLFHVAFKDHHPDFDYSNNTGRYEGATSMLSGTPQYWELKPAIHALYRACVRGLPLVKHFYWLNAPLAQMKDKVRGRFMQNQYVRDPEAVRHLIYNGWIEYNECILFRRSRTAVNKFFEHESIDELARQYTEEEGRRNSERDFAAGARQRREGPYDGHWSEAGQASERAFAQLAGRIPRGWTTARGYFDHMVADGTNYYEKNLDYEGWYTTCVDPDIRAAQRDLRAVIDAEHEQPRHYASKNRRSYRRFVQDMKTLMATPLIDMYTHNRDQLFQMFIREERAESNRIAAERKLALIDDDMYSTRFDEAEVYLKQAIREMPHPRLWATDAFYFRWRYLSAPLEYNWARVPLGAEQDKLLAAWLDDTLHYAAYTSDTLASLRVDKQRNAMAWTWADFYAAFDPDVPATRRLPWYDAAFDYDRRYKWDERCMRMKRWLQSGTIDCAHNYFDSEVYKWEQFVNRCENLTYGNVVHERYMAPRMVQLYRGLGRLMHVALASQLCEALTAASRNDNNDSLDALVQRRDVPALQARLAALDLRDFRFAVPTLIYPDGTPQRILDIDGRVIGERANTAQEQQQPTTTTSAAQA